MLLVILQKRGLSDCNCASKFDLENIWILFPLIGNEHCWVKYKDIVLDNISRAAKYIVLDLLNKIIELLLLSINLHKCNLSNHIETLLFKH